MVSGLGVVALVVAPFVLTALDGGDRARRAEKDRALAVVQAEELASWMPPGGAQERRRETKTVGSVQGIPARGVVERDVVVPAKEVEAAFTAAVADAEADGWELTEDGGHVTLPRGTSWHVNLSKDGACRCWVQLSGGAAVFSTEPDDAFTGLTIRMSGWPANGN